MTDVAVIDANATVTTNCNGNVTKTDEQDYAQTATDWAIQQTLAKLYKMEEDNATDNDDDDDDDDEHRCPQTEQATTITIGARKVSSNSTTNNQATSHQKLKKKMAGLVDKLEKRLQEAIATRDGLQVKVKKSQESLQRLFTKTAKRPRDTITGIDVKIAALERERTITSVSLAKERDILRQIKSLERSKTQVQESQILENEVQATKKLIDEMRDEIRARNSSIDELEAGLAKLKLANKLGCTTQDIIEETMECPSDKVGMVIGKGGSTMKRIMEETKVTLDVDKTTNVISISGSAEGIANAKKAIEKITLSLEIEFVASKDVVSYLTTKHVTLIQQLRDDHEELYVDVDRSSGRVSIRGMPDPVMKVRSLIETMKMERRDMVMTRRETLILVGRKGATIDRLTKAHMVAIDVGKIDKTSDSVNASIIGPEANVQEAADEISSLLHDNKEVIETIPVSVMMKRILITDAAKHLREIQDGINAELDGEDETGNDNGNTNSKSNVYLTFDKDQRDSTHPELTVKAKQHQVMIAVELAEKGIETKKSLIVNRPISTDVIPYIIGKKGENIKKITKDSKAYLEVERDQGCISVGATTAEERDAALAKLDDVIRQNQILKIDGDANMADEQFREMIRSKQIEEFRKESQLDFVDETSQFVLRGTDESNQRAHDLIQEFLKNNYVRQLELTDEDVEALQTGGKGSSNIKKIQTEHAVQLNIIRSKSLIVVKGLKDNVEAAVTAIEQFLNGGEGYSVSKISVSEQVVGIVIGKGGKTRVGLEEKYEGVSINISKTHRISIRGPDEQVAACRVEILRLIASARVTQTIKVAEEQKVTLEKNGVVRRIMRSIPVLVKINEESAEIRGNFHDVRDAMSLFKEQLSGVYTSSIELDPSQFAKLRNTCRDPAHIARMEADSKAKIYLDVSAGTLVVSGKRTNVRNAKSLLFGFLDFVIPNELLTIKLPKSLHASVGKATELTDVSANASGCTVYFDRDISSVIIVSPDPEKVKAAEKLVQQKMKDGEKLAFMIELDRSELWMISIILGKDGGRIKAMQKDTNCIIDVSKETRTVIVTGKAEEDTAKARQALDDLIDTARKTNVFFSMPEAAMPKFVGKGGANVKQMAATIGADIQRTRKGNQFKITGTEEKVKAAKNAVDAWLAKWQESSGTLELNIEKNSIPTVLGNKGETIRSLENEFSVRIDVDRTKLLVTIRNGSAEKRSIAAERINALLEADKAIAAEKAAAAAAAAAAKAEAKKNADEAPKPQTSNGNGNKKSNDEAVTEEIATGDKNYARASEFPSNPVGVASSNGRRGGQQGGLNTTSVQNGTEAGRSLFQMLIGGN